MTTTTAAMAIVVMLALLPLPSVAKLLVCTGGRP
jgi:hypothetical protein